MAGCYAKFFLLAFLFFTQFSYSASSMDEDNNNAINRNIALKCPHCDQLRDECLTLKQNGKGASGKWLDSVTPKRGWSCTSAEDLGNTQLCEMCEKEQVRYVHHMSHGVLNLDVGCICSGYMEGRFDDLPSIRGAIAATKKRKQELKSRDDRRANFPGLDRWKTSKNGNPYISYRGKIITIFGENGNFSAVINDESTKNSQGKKFIGTYHVTLQDAKLAAFDYLYPARIPAGGN